MATLRDIRRRINSVKSTQQITKAMKMVAAAKLRRAQQRVVESRPYAYKLQEVIGSLALRTPPEDHPLLTHRETGQKALVVVAADKGLCGAFNANILRKAFEYLQQAGEAEVHITLLVVGRKARDFFRRRHVERQGEWIHIFDHLAYSHAAEIGSQLSRGYINNELDEAHLLYNEFKSAGVQRPVMEQLLPIAPLAVEAEDLQPVEFAFEPSPGAILGELLPRHVEVQVYRALLESAAAEQGARMTAMEAATKSASDMIERLTLVFNKARQERITKELMDIVGGAEALRKAGTA
ncbi:MAG: ATP synthase F1 subunit gamma [Candidatus Methylomirabilales bacterium]